MIGSMPWCIECFQIKLILLHQKIVPMLKVIYFADKTGKSRENFFLKLVAI